MVATITNPLRVGLRQERVIAPQCLVIFGASGDLTHRKLVPALFELFKQRRLPSEFALLGCARRPWTDEVFRGKMTEALAPRIEENPAAWEQFVSKLFYEPVDLQKPEDVVRLGGRLELIDQQCATRSNRTFYLSVSPNFYASGCRALSDAGLLKDPKRSRVVIEKPFGRDYGSAQALNKVVQTCGQENQIFRIDHYLGKETVQNIMVMRFANTIFEPIWNRNYISSVQITASETVGVEERAGYYESSEPCGTWCKTISPKCWPSQRWSLQDGLILKRSAMKKPRCCKQPISRTNLSPGTAAFAGNTVRGELKPTLLRGIARNRALKHIAPPKPMWR